MKRLPHLLFLSLCIKVICYVMYMIHVLDVLNPQDISDQKLSRGNSDEPRHNIIDSMIGFIHICPIWSIFIFMNGIVAASPPRQPESGLLNHVRG